MGNNVLPFVISLHFFKIVSKFWRAYKIPGNQYIPISVSSEQAGICLDILPHVWSTGCLKSKDFSTGCLKSKDFSFTSRSKNHRSSPVPVHGLEALQGDQIPVQTLNALQHPWDSDKSSIPFTVNFSKSLKDLASSLQNWGPLITVHPYFKWKEKGRGKSSLSPECSQVFYVSFAYWEASKEQDLINIFLSQKHIQTKKLLCIT